MDEIYDLKEMALMEMRKIVMEALEELKKARLGLEERQVELMRAKYELARAKEAAKEAENQVIMNFEPTGRNADERKRELLRALQEDEGLQKARDEVVGQECVVMEKEIAVEVAKNDVRNAYDTWQTCLALLSMNQEV